MSTTARRYWLQLLKRSGVREFRAKSGLGLPYICHIGDHAGEAPFFVRHESAAEIVSICEWCREVENPVVFDVGANLGFVATQIAQLLPKQSARVYAFEPIPSTYAKLSRSIQSLGLERSIKTICCALSDVAGVTRMCFNPNESLFAQVWTSSNGQREGTKLALCPTLTVDQIVDALHVRPSLIKIDVEGWEASVLKGAKALLTSSEPPAICFEWNPVKLRETNAQLGQFAESLKGYSLHYISDFEGQRLQLGTPIKKLLDLDWVSNIFAVPFERLPRWSAVLQGVQLRLERLR